MALVYNVREAKVRFSVGGYRGSDLFAGIPTSRAVNCRTRDVEDGAGPMQAFGRLAFDRASGVYTYRWSIDVTWLGTCRRLDLTFADGTSHPVMLKFADPAHWQRNGRCGLPLFSTAALLNGAASISPAAGPERARSC
jgi:hypothetical protein